MDLLFQSALADGYKSSSQKIKILSEHWVGREVYCPNCGHAAFIRYENNRPVADFYCPCCNEDYELKSQGKTFGSTIADGAYRTMMERLSAANNPNLLLLHYDPKAMSVLNLMVIPKHFFIPDAIVERRPLGPHARRAGWTGCNISLEKIPHSGRIFLVRNHVLEPREMVLSKWKMTLFLRDELNVRAKGWLLSVMRCIERIKRATFVIDELYRFEDELRATFPSNRHIKAKIRQQLQILRDQGYLQFVGRGTYRLTNPNIG